VVVDVGAVACGSTIVRQPQNGLLDLRLSGTAFGNIETTSPQCEHGAETGFLMHRRAIGTVFVREFDLP